MSPLTPFVEGYVLPIDKPLGWTSSDVVRKVKVLLRRLGYRKIKIGHAGTLDPLATGVLLFCGVQLCYFLRLYPKKRRSLWGVRLGLFLLSLVALRFLGLLTALNVLALFYFSNFLCNALLSLGCPGRRARIFSAGLCLFLCCDLCVAAYQFPGSLPDAVFQAARVGMWLFYLPGQVLIALSGLPESLT